jgi:uncharacterized membrane protein YhaH (DUF805 family)
MAIWHLFGSFAGRLGRNQFWLGSLELAAIFILTAAFASALKTPQCAWDPSCLAAAPVSTLKSAILFSIERSVMTVEAAKSLIALGLIAYPFTALMVKRLRDRNRPIALAAAFWSPILVLPILRLRVTLVEVPGQLGTLTTTGWILAAFSLAVFVWALIELGMLRGTGGPSTSRDPLAV